MPASAHAELVLAEPPSEGLLTTPPRKLELWFSEPIGSGDGSPTVRLVDEAGRDIAVTSVRVDPDDATRLIVVPGAIAPGTVTVAWSVRSATDGHTLTGTYAFRVGAGRAPGAATIEGERPRVWAVLTRWLTFAGAAFVAGALLFGVIFALPGEESTNGVRRRRMTGCVAATIALIATLLEPLLQSRWPPEGSVAPSVSEAVAGLPVAWWLRPALLLSAAALCWFAIGSRHRGTRPATWLGVAAALGALLGLSLTSHAAGRESWRTMALVANAAHQWAVALWIGGLAHLALWTIDRDRPPGDRPVRRFSKVALGLVAIGAGAGIANAGFVFPDVRALWTSAYGNLLLLKMAVLIVPLGLAAFNRRRLRAAAGTLVSVAGRMVRIEAAAVLVVVLGGSALALFAPPRVEADRVATADVPLPVFAAYDGQDLLVHLLFTPGRAGENDLAVRLTRGDRTPFSGETPDRVRLQLANLALTGDGEPIDATLSGDGTWRASGVLLGSDGWWRIEVTIRWAGRPDVVAPFYLMLPDPNLNGLDAPDQRPASEGAAVELYARAMAVYTSLHRVRYDQSMASHQGTVGFGVHVINDGSDGSTPGFTYEAPGGWQYVVLGTTGWSRLPGEEWEQSEVNPMILPVDWGKEYAGATGFRLGRIERVAGEDCQIVRFVVPGTEHQTVAWYLWWVGVDSGRLYRQAMISQSHYMVSDYSGFDEPVKIRPPELFANPATATASP